MKRRKVCAQGHVFYKSSDCPTCPTCESAKRPAGGFMAELATGPTFAHAMTKRMLHHEWALSIDAALDAEADAQAICMQTGDFRRAYAAFVAKQKPVFEGN